MNKHKCRVAWWFTQEFFERDIYETGLQRIRKHSSLIDEILPCWYCADGDGKLIQMASDERVAEVKNLCGELEITLIPLIAPTSVDNLKRILSNETVRSENIKRILEIIEKQDLVGVDVDYEGLPREFRECNTEFFIALGSEMRAARKTLSFPLQPKTYDDDPSVPGASAQDYGVLAAHVDHLRVMCYDQHHPVYAAPGPVGGAPWAAKVMEYAASLIPREKLYMGLPVYGHEWDLSGAGRHRYLTYADCEEIAASRGLEVLWDNELCAPHFSYETPNGKREIWYTNASCFTKGLETALRHRVAGISIWVLTGEDPGIWEAIGRLLA